MKVNKRTGLLLLLIAILMGSCSKENVMLETTPQVKKQIVSFSFFEKTITPLETESQASSRSLLTRATDLKSQNLYTELEVCLIPKGEENDSGYVVRQENWEDDFGMVSLTVPPGDYTLVAVAAKTNLNQDERIVIKSKKEMIFPNNSVTDMAYATQDIKVESGSKQVSQNIALNRGVCSFRLSPNDQMPLNAASETFTITGNCGTVFNPSTGFCKEIAPIYKTIEFDAKKYQNISIKFNVYLLLASNDEANISITATAKDENENPIKTCSFDNVHLVIGQRTIYTGPVFTYTTNSMTFSMNQSDITESNYGKNF